MPALTNPRHERFCDEVEAGQNGTDAYAKSYNRAPDATARANASKLLAQPNIQDRIAEKRSVRTELARKATERAAEALSITVEGLIAEAEEARLLAMEIGQPAAAIGAIKEKGVLSGLRVEKSERKNTSDARSLTDAELDEAIADALAREEAAARHPAVTH